MADPRAGAVDPRTAAAVQSWQSSLSTLGGTVDAALAELAAELDGHIAAGADGMAAFEAALIQAETRIAGIRRDIDAARGDLEHAFNEVLPGAAPEAARALRWQRFEQRKLGIALSWRLEEGGQRMLVAKQAALARALFERASEEWNTPRPCRACGAGIVVGGVWEPTNFTCAACGVVTTVHPGPETAAFYRDGHIAQICAEGALDAWAALQQSIQRFRLIAHPLPDDFAPVEALATDWASTTHELRGQLDPHWDAARVEAAVAEMARDALAELGDDEPRAARAAMAEGCRIAATGDLGAVLTWARSQDDNPAAPVAALARCLHEHDQRGPAWQVLALQHHVQRVSDDRDAWMRARLAEMDEDLRTR